MFSLSIYHSKLKSQWDNFIDKSKNGTFLFLRDFLEYHKDQFEDYSILFYKDNDMIAKKRVRHTSKEYYCSHYY